MLLDCSRETYILGTSGGGSITFRENYSDLLSYADGNATFDHGFDLATFRRLRPNVAGAPVGVLAFRGTLPPRLTLNFAIAGMVTEDWLQDADAIHAPAGGIPGAWTHVGFDNALDGLLRATNAAGATLETLLRGLAAENGRLWITGHSKGGTLAHLAAWRCHTELGFVADRLTVASFAAARPGNAAFAAAYNEAIRNATRYEIVEDLVPRLPPGEDSAIDDAIAAALPAAARAMLQQMVAVNKGYCAVGRRVAGEFSMVEWAKGRAAAIGATVKRLFGGGPGPGQGSYDLPLLAYAHSIAPGDPYDKRAVCQGGANCTHAILA
jgi:hypothetical protein